MPLVTEFRVTRDLMTWQPYAQVESAPGTNHLLMPTPYPFEGFICRFIGPDGQPTEWNTK